MFRSRHCVFGASLFAVVAACQPDQSGDPHGGGGAGGAMAEGTGGTAQAKLAAKGITTGDSHSCALLVDGGVRCWGWNLDGQLGDGTVVTSRVPVAVPGITGAVAVAAGGLHSCALLGDGTVQCWGDTFSSHGLNPAEECKSSQIPACAIVPVTAPTPVSELIHPAAITGGYFHNCALMPAGTIECWGTNQSGALGNPTSTSTKLPVTVSGITDAVAVDAGHTVSCAALANGTVQCWGDNPYGALGNGTSGNHSDVPVTVNGITDAVEVAAGSTFACALHAGGTIACWGANWWNQLGDGTGGEGVSCANPVGVAEITDAVMIVAGGVHACALLRDSTVKCWGYGYYGQLGSGTNPYRSSPVTVSGLANVIALAAGESHTCAVLSGGTVRCWGANGNGQLGDGTITASSVPVTVVGF